MSRDNLFSYIAPRVLRLQIFRTSSTLSQECSRTRVIFHRLSAKWRTRAWPEIWTRVHLDYESDQVFPRQQNSLCEAQFFFSTSEFTFKCPAFSSAGKLVLWRPSACSHYCIVLLYSTRVQYPATRLPGTWKLNHCTSVNEMLSTDLILTHIGWLCIFVFRSFIWASYFN